MTFYKCGWRPAIGWVCVLGLIYQFIIQPMLPWFVFLISGKLFPLPIVDNESIYSLVFGAIGLGGLRTFERIKGKA